MFDLFKSHTPKPAKGARKPSGADAQPKAEVAPKPPQDAAKPASDEGEKAAQAPAQPGERGGPKGLEPTRYGDWERKGICYDF